MNKYKKINIMLLTVCCELRKDLKDHHFLKNCKKIGEFLSNPEYFLLENIFSDSPIQLVKGNNSVMFEVYEVNISILEEISDLKDYYYSNCEHNLHDKKIINSPFGQSIIYISTCNITKEYKILTECDYADYLKYKKIIN